MLRANCLSILWADTIISQFESDVIQERHETDIYKYIWNDGGWEEHKQKITFVKSTIIANYIPVRCGKAVECKSVRAIVKSFLRIKIEMGLSRAAFWSNGFFRMDEFNQWHHTAINTNDWGMWPGRVRVDQNQMRYSYIANEEYFFLY